MKYADKVNDRLKKLLLVPKYKGLQKTAEAAAYSLNAGGKRYGMTMTNMQIDRNNNP